MADNVFDLISILKNTEDSYTEFIENNHLKHTGKLMFMYMKYSKVFETDEVISSLDFIMEFYFTKSQIADLFEYIDENPNMSYSALYHQIKKDNRIEVEMKKAKKQSDAIKLEKIQVEKMNLESIQLTQTKPRVVKKEYRVKLNCDNLFSIFNNIIPTKYAPLISYKKYYKYHNLCSLPNNWKGSLNNAITIKLINDVNQKLTENIPISYFYNAFVYKNNADEVFCDFKITYKEKTDISVYHSNYMKIINSLFSNCNISTSETRLIKYEWYILDHHFNSILLLDMLMNDPLFYKQISISDDFLRRKKHEYGLISGKDIKTNCSFRFLNEIVSGFVPNELTDVKEKTKYISVKISGESEDDIFKTIDMLSDIFKMYLIKKDSVKQVYEKYVKVDDIEVKTKHGKSDTFMITMPRLYDRMYNRKCMKNRIPTIVSKEEAEKIIKDGGLAIKYPLDESIDKPRYYTCKDNEYKWISVIKNPKENNRLTEYVPCCKKTNESEKQNSNYQRYMEGIVTEKPKPDTNNIYMQSRILNAGDTGFISKDVKSFLYILTGDENIIRYGVNRDKQSFLSCMNHIFNKNITRYDLLPYIQVSLQELYDYTMTEIEKLILDENNYINPLLFTSLMECCFGVNICVIAKNKNWDISIVNPRNIQGYYKKRIYEKTVFIYEHFGAKIDPSIYPQCEVIYFGENIVIDCDIETIYKEQIFGYFFHDSFPFEVTGQFVDSFGKTRAIRHNSSIFIKCSPMQPMCKCDVLSYSEIIPVEKDMAIAFLNTHKLEYVDNGEDLLFEYGVIRYKKIQESSLTSYLTAKKKCAYTIQYLLWLLSQKEHGNITGDIIEIDDSFSYNLQDIKEKFSYDCPLLRNNKIVLSSQNYNHIQKLIDFIKIRKERDILTYKDHKYIPDYYSDITDFTEYRQTFIIRGVENYKKIAYAIKEALLTIKNVVNENKKVYLLVFKNKATKAYNTTSLFNAIGIAENLYYNNYFDKKSINLQTTSNYIFHRYVNDDDIKTYFVINSAKTNPSVGEIIGYKKNGEAHYIVLW